MIDVCGRIKIRLWACGLNPRRNVKTPNIKLGNGITPNIKLEAYGGGVSRQREASLRRADSRTVVLFVLIRA